MRRLRRLTAQVAPLLVLLAACTTDPQESDRSPAPSGSPTTSAPSAPVTSPGTVSPSAPEEPAEVDVAGAMRTVRQLAALGPREATSEAFATAAELVRDRLAAAGFDVSLQEFTVPEGVSWGVPVRRGRSANVVARPPGFDPAAPHVVVGAHLDTVPQSPGAEDNASGVALVLELARLVQQNGSRLPVVLVAFGAEEPRGPGDDEHHFGSQVYVRRSAGAEADARVAMVSLDRVGAGRRVPVCSGELGPLTVRRQLLAAADAVGVRATACWNRTSDHWPFEKAGGAVARLGGNPSPGYHSPRDLPREVSRRQLGRVGAVVWHWLAPPP